MAGPNARVTQSSATLVTLTSPNARVTQSSIILVCLPAVPPPPPAGQVSGNLGSGTPYALHARGTCTKRTGWDDCLDAEAARLRKITFPPLCAIPLEYCDQLPWDDTFGAIPPQSVQIQQSKGITTPAPAAGDLTVFSFRVGMGYDALITGFYTGYSGTGFIQGSGDIIFRIKVNQKYLPGFSNMNILLGSSKSPVPMTQGQVVYSGQTVSLIVNVPNLSGLIQIGASTVFGGLLGFAWPR